MEVNPPKQEHLLALKGKLVNLTPLNVFSPLFSLVLEAFASQTWPLGCRPHPF